MAPGSIRQIACSCFLCSCLSMSLSCPRLNCERRPQRNSVLEPDKTELPPYACHDALLAPTSNLIPPVGTHIPIPSTAYRYRIPPTSPKKKVRKFGAMYDSARATNQPRRRTQHELTTPLSIIKKLITARALPRRSFPHPESPTVVPVLTAVKLELRTRTCPSPRTSPVQEGHEPTEKSNATAASQPAVPSSQSSETSCTAKNRRRLHLHVHAQ